MYIKSKYSDFFLGDDFSNSLITSVAIGLVKKYFDTDFLGKPQTFQVGSLADFTGHHS